MFYSAFGLVWESRSLSLPELPLETRETLCQPDVWIEPQSPEAWPELPDDLHNTPFLRMGQADLRLTVEGVGQFRVHDGNRIAWHRWSDSVSDSDLRAFLLGSVFGAILIQRGFLVLHGNALVREGQAIVSLGYSGAGKSTLAYCLMSQGWQLLADDLVAIAPNGQVLPGVPRIKLWEDAVEAFGLDPASLTPVREKLHKYTMMGEHVQPANQLVPLRSLYCIHQTRHESGDKRLGVMPITSQKEAVLLLRNHTYRPRFVRGLGQEGANFLAIARLQQRVALANLSLPRGIAAMQTYLQQIELLTAATTSLEATPVGGVV